MADLGQLVFFFFNDTATTEIYTLSLHDALPIYPHITQRVLGTGLPSCGLVVNTTAAATPVSSTEDICRSEEHTSELQSRLHLVCRLLLEKKNSTHSRDR